MSPPDDRSFDRPIEQPFNEQGNFAATESQGAAMDRPSEMLPEPRPTADVERSPEPSHHDTVPLPRPAAESAEQAPPAESPRLPSWQPPAESSTPKTYTVWSTGPATDDTRDT
jgi:hypothetical protein